MIGRFSIIKKIVKFKIGIMSIDKTKKLNTLSLKVEKKILNVQVVLIKKF